MDKDTIFEYRNFTLLYVKKENKLYRLVESHLQKGVNKRDGVKNKKIGGVEWEITPDLEALIKKSIEADKRAYDFYMGDW